MILAYAVALFFGICCVALYDTVSDRKNQKKLTFIDRFWIEKMFDYDPYALVDELSSRAEILPPRLLITRDVTDNAYVQYTNDGWVIVIAYSFCVQGKNMMECVVSHELGHIINGKHADLAYLAHLVCMICGLFSVFLFLNLAIFFFSLEFLAFALYRFLEKKDEFDADRSGAFLLNDPWRYYYTLENFSKIPRTSRHSLFAKFACFFLDTHPSMKKRAQYIGKILARSYSNRSGRHA
jgi:Zn-dependent protease with chaperone function